MLLWRLGYPSRYSYMMARFGRPAPVLSMITNEVLDFIYTNHSHRILQQNPAILQPVKLEEYANAIQIKGGALDNCFGFIDGTVRPISRPGKNQRIVYDGHKRVHALKFQSLAPPNGLIANMYGPVGEYVNEILPVYTDECLHLYSVIFLGWIQGLAEGNAATPSCMKFCIIFKKFSLKQIGPLQLPTAPPLSEISCSAPDLYWKELLEMVQFYIYRLSRLLFVRLSRVCHVCCFFFSLFLRRQFFCCFLIVRRCCFSEGRKHDSGMLADFGLLHYLQLHAASP